MYRGALGVVLYIGRVAGVAPFLRGDEFRVSSLLVICAKLFITITALSFIIFTATSPLWIQKFGSLWALDILKSSSTLFVIMAAFVSVFTSSKRTLRLMRLLKELDKIDHQRLDLGDFRQNTNERKLTILILIYLHVSLVIRFYDFFLIEEPFKETIYTSLCFMVLIAYYMVNLSEVQFILFAKRMMLSLKRINDSLEKISNSKSVKVYIEVALYNNTVDVFIVVYVCSMVFADISQIQIIKILPLLAWGYDTKVPYVNARSKSDKTEVAKIQEPVNFIRQCAANYVHVCNIITTSVEGDGVLVVILVLSYILHLLSPAYKLILYTTSPDPQNYEANILLTILWFVIYAVTLVAFVEPIHKTHSEIQRLQLLLTSFLLKNLEKDDINNELLLFRRLITLNKPTYSPLGMFNLNRSLILKIVGGLVTYLVIIVTYGPDTKNHSASN